MDGPGGRLQDIGGPEIMEMRDLSRAWFLTQNRNPFLINLPIPGKVAAGFRAGLNTTQENRYGTITWQEWLTARYGVTTQTVRAVS